MGTITESAKAFMPKLSEIRRDFTCTGGFPA